MIGFIGEFPSTVDAKGRFLLPASLQKQIPAKEQKCFVIHRGIEKHLVFYTKKEWEKISERVNNLNLYIKKNRDFIRMFNRGATEIEMDGTSRLLLPKSLMEYAGIDKDIVLFAFGSRIELWSEKGYEKMLKEDKTDFAALAEEVMGRKMMEKEMYHEPVLLHESVDALNIRQGGIYVDATFGGGGHSGEILGRLNDGKLFGFDQDEDAIKNAIKDKRFMLISHNYRYIKKFLRYYNALPVDGVIADLGISSHQIDTATRGFSTRFDADLDMRMNRSAELTAETILNSYDETQLTKIFSEYGEIRNTKTLVARIVEERKIHEITNTNQFKQLINPVAERGNENQYYAQVFQALRIEVNDELGALKDFLESCAEVITTGGRLVVIAYHSLEDRLVKNFISKGRFEGEAEKDIYGNAMSLPFRSVSKKPILASEEEINRNPRARSAKMRIAERI